MRPHEPWLWLGKRGDKGVIRLHNPAGQTNGHQADDRDLPHCSFSAHLSIQSWPEAIVVTRKKLDRNLAGPCRQRLCQKHYSTFADQI
jgi:hypothetical protein